VPDIDVSDDPGFGAIRALDPKTGDKVWEYKTHTKPWSGVLTTASHLLFGANGGWLSINVGFGLGLTAGIYVAGGISV